MNRKPISVKLLKHGGLLNTECRWFLVKNIGYHRCGD
jgi:hypothetical protein